MRKPKTWRVRWEVDVDALTAREAAEKALEIQRRQDSIATFFALREWGQRKWQKIDLDAII